MTVKRDDAFCLEQGAKGRADKEEKEKRKIENKNHLLNFPVNKSDLQIIKARATLLKENQFHQYGGKNRKHIDSLIVFVIWLRKIIP